MEARYKKAKATRIKNYGKNVYSEMGKVGGKNKRSWMTGNSEAARALVQKRWDKVKKGEK